MNDSSVHVTRWGNSGPRVVLVHGSAQGSEVGGERHFSRQKSLADAGLQLLVPDRPGHGLSPDPGRPDDAEADGVWVADMLGDGAHLVGHSFGGCVALAAAARRPEAVRSLTLIEPAVLALAPKRPEVRRMLIQLVTTTYLTFSDSERIRRFCSLLHIPDDIRGGADEAMLRRMGKAIKRLKLPSPAALKRQIAAVKGTGVPFLIVTGGWSPAFDVSSDAAAELGGADRLVIRSPHHFPQLISDEFNTAFAALVRTAEAARVHA